LGKQEFREQELGNIEAFENKSLGAIESGRTGV
jgi:hypothetical protein